MGNNKIATAAEAIAIVKDGDLVVANFWGPGSPAHLWRALRDHGAKDLTVCINNYVPKPDVLREKGTPDPSLILSQTKKIIAAFTGISSEEIKPIADEIEKRLTEGSLEFENMSHGNLIERLYAAALGLGGIYSPIGVGTSVAEGREKRTINGKEYIFLEPIVPDVGLISAAKADTLGNLVYHGTARASNPIIAMASRYTIAEVLEIVEPGELDPDHIVTPGVFIDRVVPIPDDDPVSKKKRREWVMASIKRRQELQEKALATQGQGGDL
jgi:3-oxoacid CoA-transferase A subunit